MKLVKPFTPHVIAWSVRKGFNQSICRTHEIAVFSYSVMPKSVIPSAQQLNKRKVYKDKKRKDLAVSVKTPRLYRFLQQNFQAAALKLWR